MIKGWHFTTDTLRDGSPIPRVGKWLHYSGKLVMCKSGLHYSLQPFDALQYAPGNILHYVEVKGEVLTQDDKGCSHYRRIVASMDATEMLRYYARMQAISCLDKGTREPEQIVLDWLMTGDESIRAAAYSAAWSAANSACWAAYSAYWAANSANSANSAWSAAREEFNALVYECFEACL